MNNSMNKKIAFGVLLILALAAPFGLYPVFLMKMLCFALFACAFNLLIGYTGLLSFGHAAFFGSAGYVAGQALQSWGLPTELGLLLGTATGALIGLVMGLLAIRRQGIYFTMVSLAYDIDRYKLLAFVLSAALTGLAGSTKALVLGFETLTDVHWTMSGLVVLMTLVGGLGTTVGPIVGAVIIVMLENKLGDIGNWLASVTHIDWFSTLGDSVTIVTGFIFIVCVLAFRRGIVGEVLHLFKRSSNASH